MQPCVPALTAGLRFLCGCGPDVAVFYLLQVLFQFAVGSCVPGEQYTFWAYAINAVGMGPACAAYSYRAPPG